MEQVICEIAMTSIWTGESDRWVTDIYHNSFPAPQETVFIVPMTT